MNKYFMQQHVQCHSINIGKIYFGYLLCILLPSFFNQQLSEQTVLLYKVFVLTLFLGIMVLKSANFTFQLVDLIFPIIYIIVELICCILSLELTATIIIGTIIVLTMLYFYLFIPKHSQINAAKSIKYFMIAFDVLIVMACLYNFIINYSLIIHISSINSAYDIDIASFFDNKNTFGLYLFVGCCISVYQFVKEKNLCYFLCLCLFFINIIMCLSRTALYSFIIYLIVFIFLFSRRKLKAVLIMMFCFVLLYFIINVVPALNDFVISLVIRSSTGSSGRIVLFFNDLSYLNLEHFIFGYGESTANHVLIANNAGNNYLHNGFLAYIYAGGVFKLLLAVMTLVYILKISYKIKKEDKILGVFLISINLAFIAYSFGESVCLFETTASSNIYMITAIAFPLMVYSKLQCYKYD